MWHFLSKWQAFIILRRLMFFTSTRADAEIIFLAYLPAGLSILNSSPTTNSSSSRWPWDSPKASVKPVASASSYSFFGALVTPMEGVFSLPGSPCPKEEQWRCWATSPFCAHNIWAGHGAWSADIPWPCRCFLLGQPGNCRKRGVGARGQIMRNREERALEGLKEQRLCLHGWVQASSRRAGSLAQDC